MALKTQGTDLYYIDPDTGEVEAVECTTSIDGVGSTRGNSAVPSCLDDPNGIARKLPGELTPGTISIGLNADPQNAAHVRLHELLGSGHEVKFALGWSDGPRAASGASQAVPSADSNGDFDLPSTRTWLVFKGFVAAFPFSFAANTVVSSTVSIEMTEPEQWVQKVVS